MKTKVIVVTGNKKDKQQAGDVCLKNFGNAKVKVIFDLDSKKIQSITIEGRPLLENQTRKTLKNNQSKNENINHEIPVQQIKDSIIKNYKNRSINSFNVKTNAIFFNEIFDSSSKEERALEEKLKAIAKYIAKEFRKSATDIKNLHNGDAEENAIGGLVIKLLHQYLNIKDFKKISLSLENEPTLKEHFNNDTLTINSFNEFMKLYKKYSIHLPEEKEGFFSQFETKESKLKSSVERKVRKKANDNSFFETYSVNEKEKFKKSSNSSDENNSFTEEDSDSVSSLEL